MKKAKSAITLKCDPEVALRIREDYPETIIPGYHMNKNIGIPFIFIRI